MLRTAGSGGEAIVQQTAFITIHLLKYGDCDLHVLPDCRTSWFYSQVHMKHTSARYTILRIPEAKNEMQDEY